MSKWTDFSIDERKTMIQAVSQTKRIDEASAEKDWWVTAVLYALFHTSISELHKKAESAKLSAGNVRQYINLWIELFTLWPFVSI